MRSLRLPALCIALAGACAHTTYLPGTTIAANEENKAIVDAVEEYRIRLMERNIEGLLVLASPRYFEDAGTPRADDDYGYDGLKTVLTNRLVRVRSLRYDIQYRNVYVKGDRAEVEVYLNGSFEVASTESGERYRRVTDNHKFVLERNENSKWKFLSGM